MFELINNRINLITANNKFAALSLLGAACSGALAAGGIKAWEIGEHLSKIPDAAIYAQTLEGFGPAGVILGGTLLATIGALAVFVRTPVSRN